MPADVEKNEENDGFELLSEPEIGNEGNTEGKGEDRDDDADSVCSSFSDVEYGFGSGRAGGSAVGGAGKEDENSISMSTSLVGTPPKPPGSVKKSLPLKVCHREKGSIEGWH